MREKLAGWLAERGLSLNEDKTRIVHLSEGFDFLGWNFRRYPGGKLLIKPSKAAVRKHRQRLAGETRRLRGSNAGRSSPRSTPSSGAGRPTTGAWCPARPSIRSGTTRGSSPTSGHGGRTRRKAPAGSASRYYGKFCPSRDDKWVFGDRETGGYLLKHEWTSIRRHVMVKGRASPDDPDLAGYWENRRRRHGPPLDAGTLALLGRQRNRCPHAETRSSTPAACPPRPRNGRTGGSASPAATSPAQPARREPPRHRTGNGTALALIHASCNRPQAQRRRKPASTRNALRGLLEPDAGNGQVRF